MRALALVVATAACLAAQPNPYRTVEHWFTLPEGRTMGSTSSVFVAPGGHIWVAERCGANTCAGSSVAPILEFDESGKSAEELRRGHVRVSAQPRDGQRGKHVGHGRPGEGRQGPAGFQVEPGWQGSDDPWQGGRRGRRSGHVQSAERRRDCARRRYFRFRRSQRRHGNARVVKFSKDGKFIKQWGKTRIGARASSKFRTRWRSIPRGGCSSGDRGQQSHPDLRPGRQISRPSGSNSAGRAGSSSTRTT